MAEDIRQAETLTDEEKQRLYGWGEDIFGVTTLDLRWRPKDLHFLVDRDGKPVSHVGVLKHTIGVYEVPVTVGGVGGVVTVPEAQGEGFARRLMQHTARFFEHEWKVDAGLLFCLPKTTAFYEALGWHLLDVPTTIEQPDGEILSPLPVMVLPLGREVLPQGSVVLRSFPW